MKNIGYIGWSWHGNGVNECNLDLSALNMVKGDKAIESNWLTNDYTVFGDELVNYPQYGIRDTAAMASYFL